MTRVVEGGEGDNGGNAATLTKADRTIVDFELLVLIKLLRPDRLTLAIQNYVSKVPPAYPCASCVLNFQHRLRTVQSQVMSEKFVSPPVLQVARRHHSPRCADRPA